MQHQISRERIERATKRVSGFIADVENCFEVVMHQESGSKLSSGIVVHPMNSTDAENAECPHNFQSSQLLVDSHKTFDDFITRHVDIEVRGNDERVQRVSEPVVTITEFSVLYDSGCRSWRTMQSMGDDELLESS